MRSLNDATPSEWDRVAKVSREAKLDEQVGGTHYTDLGIQPFELTYANFGYYGLRAAVYTKVNKYLTRKKLNQKEDIKKAIHCLEILLEHTEEYDQ